jgi:hypothetical protein
LIFGISISTLLTLVVIPLLYFMWRASAATSPAGPRTRDGTRG